MPSENLAVLKNLTQSLKPLLHKYKLLEDIIIFGSLVREKAHPKDIDLALLAHTKDEPQLEKIEEEIRNLFPDFKIDITIITLKELYAHVWLFIMQEGWSIAQEAFLSALYGIQPTVLYKYSLKMLTPVQKVQFDRGMTKMLQDLKGIRLTRTVVLVPLQKSEQFEEFLKTWKIEFETQRYTLMPEYRKQEKFHSYSGRHK